MTVLFTHSDLELELEQQYQECQGVNVCDLKKIAISYHFEYFIWLDTLGDSLHLTTEITPKATSSTFQSFLVD